MASSSSTPRTNISDVSIAPTTHADLPALVECELLAFSGAFPPINQFALLACPFRAPLARAGVRPQLWPDFASTVRRHARNLRAGSLYYTAFLPDENGKKQVAGMISLERPRAAAAAARVKRTWKERALHDYVYPAVDAVQDKLSGGANGVDMGFVSTAAEVLKKSRDEVASKGECYIIDVLYVHPHLQRRGVGSALLKHCIAIADAERVSMYIEASEAGEPLYSSFGFNTIRTLRIEYRGEVVVMPAMVRSTVDATEPSSVNDVPKEDEQEEYGDLQHSVDET